MKQINVVAAVIVQDDRILATQRGYGEFKDGWEFPGGKIESGESPEDALKREIMEELKVEIDVRELIGVVEYDYTDFHLNMMCFWFTLKGREVQLMWNMRREGGSRRRSWGRWSGCRRIGNWLKR